MDLVNRTASASVTDASFDTLARTLGQPLPRRRALRLLAATLATGALGTAALTDAAAKGKSQSQSRGDRITAERRKGGKGGGKGGGSGPIIVPPTTTTTQPPIQQPATTTTQPPVRLPDASQNCRAAGNQCGTNAGQQGTCRVAVAPDNQAGFICTSNQAGNTCTASTQCGAGTRCVIEGNASTCRVVVR